MEENNVNSVNAENAEVVTPQQTTEPVSEPVTSEKVVVAEPQQESKPVQSAEDNARFAEVRRKAESEARDKVIADMYGESHGIKTYADYQRALAEQSRQQEVERLQSDNIPEDLANEIVESRKFRQQYESEQRTKAEQLVMQKNYEQFMTDFPGVKAEEIPKEVWEDVAQGMGLSKAYKAYSYANENTKLKAELEAFKKGSTTLETNNKNAATSTGSTTGNGANVQDFISFDAFETNKHDQRWVIKNLSKINESRSKW